MILVYSAVLSAYVYTYVALHIRRCLRCYLVLKKISTPCPIFFSGTPLGVAAQENGARKRRAESVGNKATKDTRYPRILLGLELN